MGAQTKLSHIIARIWDDLEGVDLTEKEPISSALWLDDAGEYIPHSASTLSSDLAQETCLEPECTVPSAVEDAADGTEVDDWIHAGHGLEPSCKTMTCENEEHERRRVARNGKSYNC